MNDELISETVQVLNGLLVKSIWIPNTYFLFVGKREIMLEVVKGTVTTKYDISNDMRSAVSAAITTYGKN